MSRVSSICIVLAALLVSGRATAASSTDGRIFDVQDPGRVYNKYISVSQTGTYRFRAGQLTGTMDTILHVWRHTGSTYGWLASNDDYATGNCTGTPSSFYESCVDVPLTQGDVVQVFVHRYSSGSEGTSRFIVSRGRTVVVDETIEPLGDTTTVWGGSNSISWDAGEKLQTAFTPVHQVQAGEPWENGLLWPVVLVLAGTEKVYKYGSSTSDFGNDPFWTGGIWGQPSIYLADASASITPAPAYSPFRLVVGGYYWDDAASYPWRYGDGSLRLYRNDALLAGRDPDGDNLGTELEEALGTCPSAASCPAADPLDSDADGFRDDWETIGGCTFFGCNIGSGDTINLAYYGGDPLIENAFVQVDWKLESASVDRWDRLEPALDPIVARYAAAESTLGHAKEPIRLFFDYGQLQAGGAGGNEGPHNPNFCLAEEAVSACVQTWQACGPGDSCPSGLTCVVDDPFSGPGKICVSTGCEARCRRHPEFHTNYYGANADGLPYNLQNVMRGDPADPYSFVPLSRRGLFTELWLQAVMQSETGGNAPPGFAQYDTCCLLSGCSGWAPDPPYPGCKQVFPGLVVYQQVYFQTGNQNDYRVGSVGIMHELGHVLGLVHSAPEVDEQSTCTEDEDCLSVSEVCRGGHCVNGYNKIANHLSIMNYYYHDGLTPDFQLDYASGERPTFEGLRDRGVSCTDPACPLYLSQSCPLPAGLSPAPSRCCLENHCVEGNLDESAGIGDYYGSGGGDYKDERTYQLGRMTGITNVAIPSYNGGVGPAPVHRDQSDAPIDWNKNGVLDLSPVGALVVEPGHQYFGSVPNVHRYEDVDEWAYIGSVGFDRTGVRELPGMAQDGVPICGVDEGIDCPAGYTCSDGHCVVTSPLLPRRGQE